MRKEIEKLLQSVQKPARYAGGELNSVMKDKSKVALRYAFCFPDTYEIGMSHLGMKILYGVANAREDTWCERVFAPADDMEALMRANGEPLFALESGDPIKDFDMIGFTMQYELSYTNILNMLDLAGVPLRAEDRKSLTPIVAFGGPCACNPEPVAEFADIIFLGEGEETTNTVLDLLKECKESGKSKQEFLEAAMHIQGIYVPSFYEDSYNPDGTLCALTPTHGAPATVKKSIVSDMNKCYYPDSFVVPFIDIVHDRAVEEIFRGCIRGCRFCQAGFIYRPIREKSVETINRQSKALIDSTGYDELSLCSLSTSDHSCVNEMLTSLIDWTVRDKINLSLPSLRVDNFSDELVDKLSKVRRSGLTFAPEAGTQRMRDVINKNVTEEEVLRTCTKAFAGGWTSVKLYFMMGLPTETMEDIAGIRIMCQFVEDIYTVVDIIGKRSDMQIIEERDYIANQKPSGYRSYHIVVRYPVQLLDEQTNIKVEIQIRTLAMNFWATIEHSLGYKYRGMFPKELKERLARSAEAAFLLDNEMSSIREEIQEAQELFNNKIKFIEKGQPPSQFEMIKEYHDERKRS